MRKEIIFENIFAIIFSAVIIVSTVFAGIYFGTKKEEPKIIIENKKAEMKEIIKAETVDSHDVQQIIDNIKQKKQDEKDEIAKQKNILKEKKIALEKQRLAQIKKEKKRVKKAQEDRIKQQIAEKQKQKKITQQKELLKLKQQKLDAEKKKVEQDKKALAEKQKQDKLKKETLVKKKLEEKKKLEAKKKLDEKKAKAVAEKKALAKKNTEAKKKAAAKKTEDARKAKENKDLLDSIGQELEEANNKEKRNKAINAFIKQTQRKVNNNWVIPAKTPRGLSTLLQIKASTKGVVKSVKVKKSSGNKIFDNSAIEAVRRSSPLPFPKNAVWAKELTTFNYRFKPQ